MPTSVVYPADSAVYRDPRPGIDSPTTPLNIVGTAPQWGNTDDSSYADLYTDGDGGLGGTSPSTGAADFTAIPTATGYSNTVTVGVQHIHTFAAFRPGVQVFFWDTVTETTVAFNNLAVAIVGETKVALAVTLDTFPGGSLLDSLIAGTLAVSARVGSGDGIIRVYDIALEVYTAEPVGPPARRLYPRTDSRGPALGRFYPPPNTPQASGRIGPSSPY